MPRSCANLPGALIQVLVAVASAQAGVVTLARTPPNQSPRLNNAYAALIEGLRAEVTDWIKGWATSANAADVKAVASVAVDALLGKRATSPVFRLAATDMDDDRYIGEWMAMIAGRVETLTEAT